MVYLLSNSHKSNVHIEKIRECEYTIYILYYYYYRSHPYREEKKHSLKMYTAILKCKTNNLIEENC